MLYMSESRIGVALHYVFIILMVFVLFYSYPVALHVYPFLHLSHINALSVFQFHTTYVTHIVAYGEEVYCYLS